MNGTSAPFPDFVSKRCRASRIIPSVLRSGWATRRQGREEPPQDLLRHREHGAVPRARRHLELGPEAGPGLQVAGPHTLEPLSRVGVEEHEHVLARPEGRRAFDPVLLRDRLRGEHVRPEGVVRHGQPDVLASLRPECLVFQEHQVLAPVPEDRGVDHVEAGIEEQLRAAVVLEVTRQCPVDPVIEGNALLVHAAGVVGGREPARDRRRPEDAGTAPVSSS